MLEAGRGLNRADLNHPIARNACRNLGATKTVRRPPPLDEDRTTSPSSSSGSCKGGVGPLPFPGRYSCRLKECPTSPLPRIETSSTGPRIRIVHQPFRGTSPKGLATASTLVCVALLGSKPGKYAPNMRPKRTASFRNPLIGNEKAQGRRLAFVLAL